MLMNLLTPGWQSASLPSHIFTLVSQGRCKLKPTSHLNQVVIYYLFSDQAVEDLEHGLDSILIYSVYMPELEVSFDEVDAIPSSVSLGLLYLVSAHSDNCRL